MKRIARRFAYPAALAVAAVLLAFMVLAGPSSSRGGLARAGPDDRRYGLKGRPC